jgi:hypothetical protein
VCAHIFREDHTFGQGRRLEANGGRVLGQEPKDKVTSVRPSLALGVTRIDSTGAATGVL